MTITYMRTVTDTPPVGLSDGDVPDMLAIHFCGYCCEFRTQGAIWYCVVKDDLYLGEIALPPNTLISLESDEFMCAS